MIIYELYITPKDEIGLDEEGPTQSFHEREIDAYAMWVESREKVYTEDEYDFKVITHNFETRKRDLIKWLNDNWPSDHKNNLLKE